MRPTGETARDAIAVVDKDVAAHGVPLAATLADRQPRIDAFDPPHPKADRPRYVPRTAARPQASATSPMSCDITDPPADTTAYGCVVQPRASSEVSSCSARISSTTSSTRPTGRPGS